MATQQAKQAHPKLVVPSEKNGGLTQPEIRRLLEARAARKTKRVILDPYRYD